MYSACASVASRAYRARATTLNPRLGADKHTARTCHMTHRERSHTHRVCGRKQRSVPSVGAASKTEGGSLLLARLQCASSFPPRACVRLSGLGITHSDSCRTGKTKAYMLGGGEALCGKSHTRIPTTRAGRSTIAAHPLLQGHPALPAPTTRAVLSFH